MWLLHIHSNSVDEMAGTVRLTLPVDVAALDVDVAYFWSLGAMLTLGKCMSTAGGNG